MLKSILHNNIKFRIGDAIKFHNPYPKSKDTEIGHITGFIDSNWGYIDTKNGLRTARLDCCVKINEAE